MQITKNYITILGLTDDRRKVVLADNRGNKEGANNNGYIFDINATGFTMMNLTVVDYCNLDYEYPGDPSKNLKMRSPVITQAVAMQMRRQARLLPRRVPQPAGHHLHPHHAILLHQRLHRGHRRLSRRRHGRRFQRLGNLFPHRQGRMSASGLTFINTVFKAARGLEFYKGFGNPDTLIDCTMPVDTPNRR